MVSSPSVTGFKWFLSSITTTGIKFFTVCLVARLSMVNQEKVQKKIRYQNEIEQEGVVPTFFFGAQGPIKC